MSIIAGDIGGTKSWLALIATDSGKQANLISEQRYHSSDFPNIHELLREFISISPLHADDITGITLALPGPVSNGRCQLTNLDWVVDSTELSESFLNADIRLMNDFEASSTGINTLEEQDLIPLNQASPLPKATKVVTGAGTGLGLAWMTRQHGSYQTFATEGGHVTFGPDTPLQHELLDYLSKKEGFTRLSYEQLLSGSGLETLYRFQCYRHNQPPHSELADAALVTTMESQGDPVATEAIESFIEIYGNWLGNLALLYRPMGGLYIAGGIAAKLAAQMQSSTFINACYNKGGMSDLVQQTPIYLVTNERLGLQGAIATATQYNRK